MTRREKSGALTARVVQHASQRACRASEGCERDNEQAETFAGAPGHAASLIRCRAGLLVRQRTHIMRWVFLFAVHVTGGAATKGDGFSLLVEVDGGLASAANPASCMTCSIERLDAHAVSRSDVTPYACFCYERRGTARHGVVSRGTTCFTSF